MPRTLGSTMVVQKPTRQPFASAHAGHVAPVVRRMKPELFDENGNFRMGGTLIPPSSPVFDQVMRQFAPELPGPMPMQRPDAVRERYAQAPDQSITRRMEKLGLDYNEYFPPSRRSGGGLASPFSRKGIDADINSIVGHIALGDPLPEGGIPDDAWEYYKATVDGQTTRDLPEGPRRARMQNTFDQFNAAYEARRQQPAAIPQAPMQAPAAMPQVRQPGGMSPPGSMPMQPMRPSPQMGQPGPLPVTPQVDSGNKGGAKMATRTLGMSSKRRDDLRKRQGVLPGRTAALPGRMDQVDMSGLSPRMDQVDMSGVGQRMDQVDMSGLAGRMDTLDMSGLKPRGSLLTSRMPAVGQRLDTLAPRAQGLEPRMNQIDMSGLEPRMDAAAGRMDELQPRVDGLRSRMDQVEPRMDAITPRMESRFPDRSPLAAPQTIPLPEIAPPQNPMQIANTQPRYFQGIGGMNPPQMPDELRMSARDRLPPDVRDPYAPGYDAPGAYGGRRTPRAGSRGFTDDGSELWTEANMDALGIDWDNPEHTNTMGQAVDRSENDRNLLAEQRAKRDVIRQESDADWEASFEPAREAGRARGRLEAGIREPAPPNPRVARGDSVIGQRLNTSPDMMATGQDGQVNMGTNVVQTSGQTAAGHYGSALLRGVPDSMRTPAAPRELRPAGPDRTIYRGKDDPTMASENLTPEQRAVIAASGRAAMDQKVDLEKLGDRRTRRLAETAGAPMADRQAAVQANAKQRADVRALRQQGPMASAMAGGGDQFENLLLAAARGGNAQAGTLLAKMRGDAADRTAREPLNAAQIRAADADAKLKEEQARQMALHDPSKPTSFEQRTVGQQTALEMFNAGRASGMNDLEAEQYAQGHYSDFRAPLTAQQRDPNMYSGQATGGVPGGAYRGGDPTFTQAPPDQISIFNPWASSRAAGQQTGRQSSGLSRDTYAIPSSHLGDWAWDQEMERHIREGRIKPEEAAQLRSQRSTRRLGGPR